MEKEYIKITSNHMRKIYTELMAEKRMSNHNLLYLILKKDIKEQALINRFGTLHNPLDMLDTSISSYVQKRVSLIKALLMGSLISVVYLMFNMLQPWSTNIDLR